MKNNMRKEDKGFTLIELLIVIGIIGFLAAAVLVAVDPVKRIQDARDSRRYSEANALLNAILTKQVDDRGLFSGVATAPIVTSPTYSQVIVATDVGIECDTDSTENYPGCHGVTLDVGAAPLTSKSCVANLGGRIAGTVDSLSTALTGTGTDFDPQISVGDVLLGSDGQECTVLTRAAAADTAATCSPAPNPVWNAVTIINKTKSVVPLYIADLPIDPRGSGSAMCNGVGDTDCSIDGIGIQTLGATNTGYYIHRTNGNRIEIGACDGEQQTVINVKR